MYVGSQDQNKIKWKQKLNQTKQNKIKKQQKPNQSKQNKYKTNTNKKRKN